MTFNFSAIHSSSVS